MSRGNFYKAESFMDLNEYFKQLYSNCEAQIYDLNPGRVDT